MGTKDARQLLVDAFVKVWEESEHDHARLGMLLSLGEIFDTEFGYRQLRPSATAAEFRASLNRAVDEASK